MKPIKQSWINFLHIVKNRQARTLSDACALAKCSVVLPMKFKELGYVEKSDNRLDCNYIYIGPDTPDWNKVRKLKPRKGAVAASKVYDSERLTSSLNRATLSPWSDIELWHELKRRGWIGRIEKTQKEEME